jgi:tRNA threonylcarbamoyl adenosine modification protein YeaZ
LADDLGVVAEWDGDLGNAVAGPMLTAAQGLLAASELGLWDIDLFAACTGPGSFTGIKIAVTLAKTLAHALSTPVVGVNSLDVLAGELHASAPVAALLPSKPGWVYLGRYEGNRPLDDGRTMPLDEVPAILGEWTGEPGLITGPMELPPMPGNWEQVAFSYPSAAGVARIALRLAAEGATVSPMELVPHYVASFSISKPKRPLSPTKKAPQDPGTP